MKQLLKSKKFWVAVLAILALIGGAALPAGTITEFCAGQVSE